MRLQIALPSIAAALALSSVASAQTGYVVDSDLDELYSVDLATGNLTFIGSTANNGLGTPAGLAWRSDTNTMWTIDLAGGEVGTLSLTDATFTPLFQMGLSGWQGISWDAARGVFILCNQNDDTYTLDPVTGTPSLLGPTLFGLVTGMDFDPAGNLWGIDFGGEIVQIDPLTGAGTSMGATINSVQGLAIDDAGTWYATDTNNDSLYIIDPATGTDTLVGGLSGLNFIKGFEIPGSGGGPFPLGTNYCTALPNSTGAASAISAFGSIVASDNDLSLTAVDVPPMQFGIFLTSETQASTPVQSGILCLGGSIIRFQGPGQILQADMNGEYSLTIDISALPAGVPTPINAGDTYNFTTWFRDIDPMVGNTANFSDGVSITFQ